GRAGRPVRLTLLEEAGEVPPPAARRIALCKERGEGAPLHELHGEEGPAVHDADLVNGDDPGMLELPAHLGLLDEPLEDARIAAVLVLKHLQGDVAAELGVVAFQDHADPAVRDLAEDLILARAARELR